MRMNENLSVELLVLVCCYYFIAWISFPMRISNICQDTRKNFFLTLKNKGKWERDYILNYKIITIRMEISYIIFTINKKILISRLKLEHFVSFKCMLLTCFHKWRVGGRKENSVHYDALPCLKAICLMASNKWLTLTWNKLVYY